MKILIVEDENIIAMELEHYILSLGYDSAGVVSSATGALTRLHESHPQLVLMDISIKGELDGIETAAEMLKIDPTIKIIFLTAHMDNYNIDRAVAIDPISYLTKPYNPKELEASIKIAHYKLTQLPAPTRAHDLPLLTLDHEFSYDEAHHTLYYCDTLVNLTKKESELLALLVAHKNSIVDYYTIENTLWPDKAANANTLRTLIRRLRPKLKHRFIQTITAQGYSFLMGG